MVGAMIRIYNTGSSKNEIMSRRTRKHLQSRIIVTSFRIMGDVLANMKDKTAYRTCARGDVAPHESFW